MKPINLGQTLHEMLIAMVECFQIADDIWFKANGKHAVAWKARNVVTRDRLTPSRVWSQTA